MPERSYHRALAVFASMVVILAALPADAQTLEERLLKTPAATLAELAMQQGDAKRGAVVFYQPYLSCRKCHAEETETQTLGPSLLAMSPKPSNAELVESVLTPSKVIKKGFETLTVLRDDGSIAQGTVVERNATRLVLRDATDTNGRKIEIPLDQIAQERVSETSSMPAGQVNSLTSRQQFLDLIRYLVEIRDGGLERARQLEPPPSLYTVAALPKYENEIDHAGIIRSFDRPAYERGEAIYARVCANCHGTHDRPGSLPTSLNFAKGKFKNGHDPYTMYQTLTRGFGLMVPQTWMVPQQKYDVVHYIREAYLKGENPTQYLEIDDEYLKSLPTGTSRGPKPSKIEPWRQMDYGPNLVATYEIGDDGKNFAYKGNAFRLDPGPGGVSRGRDWMIFDYDTLRMAAAWTGRDFIDYRGINFDGSHNSHPRLAGAVRFANPTGPGWGRPGTDSFEDPRLVGRDDRRYGPLPRQWAKYHGMYYHGNETIVSYSVGKTDVLESGALAGRNEALTGEGESRPSVFVRRFTIGPRDEDMIMQVAHDAVIAEQSLRPLELNRQTTPNLHQAVAIGKDRVLTHDQPKPRSSARHSRFDGSSYFQIENADSIDMETEDYTILARIKTKQDGTIFCKTADGTEWVPGGKSLFVRGGRLTFDIGWVGAVRSNRKVADNRWHDVAVTYRAADGQFRFFVDGQEAGGGRMKPKKLAGEPVARIGYTSENFPGSSPMHGQIDYVAFMQSASSSSEAISNAHSKVAANRPLQDAIAVWNLRAAEETPKANAERRDSVANSIPDTRRQTDMSAIRVQSGSDDAAPKAATGPMIFGLASESNLGSQLSWDNEGPDLRLRIPAGSETLRFALWMTRLNETDEVDGVSNAVRIDQPSRDLQELCHGGPARWPEAVTTRVELGNNDGPFAVDTLTYPLVNPWQCRMRLTGHDFYSDPDRIAVCDWDGNIWLVSGISRTFDVEGKSESGAEQAAPELTWKRIASGLFQPLGLRIIDDVIHVTCRDQLVRLHDLNGDESIDWYECINNDHQVTDHFHEFAMGLQTDGEGNFYYAKSARHALPALVPHHGTLLRIAKDGSKTEILANGFRAANGVCLNPDGTFIVTDQEGHWNPKNRINWVRPGGFYGNMYGYHDVTDESDDAMEQPLCWITNAFDRSPAELLWVDSDAWGPLRGRLLNVSYGYGKVFLVPHESIDGQMQGGMIELPIPQFPTGTIRGRFSPFDGQLYLSGMFAWAGSRNAPGGLYRLRYTGQPACLPVELNATERGLSLTFTEELSAEDFGSPSDIQISTWDLKRTKNYGSKHYNEQTLAVKKVRVDGRTLSLEIPDLQPTWGMEIRYEVVTASGRRVRGTIHNTIHNLGGNGD